MTTFSSRDRELLQSKEYATFVTLDEGGMPHATPVWVDLDEVGNVLVNSVVGRRKDRNIQRDPRVAVCVFAKDEPLRWLSVQGTVESAEIGPEAETLIDALSRRYDGEPWSYVPGQVRITYRIHPDRVIRSS